MSCSDREPLPAHYIDKDARVAVLEAQGLEGVWLLPTLGVLYEELLKHDPEAVRVQFRAFNRWLDEDWGCNYKGKIFASPYISLCDVGFACEELEWALAHDARTVVMRPAAVWTERDGVLSPSNEHFDPFWARVHEAGVSVAFHIAESGYNEMMSVHFGEEPNPSSHLQSAFQWSCFYGDRPIMDTMSSLILYNLFGRFPNLRVLSVENGSLWVSYLMKVMDKMKGMGRNGPWPGGYVSGRPSEVVREKVFVSPYHEEDIVALAELIGPGHVLFGSDFPHPEGLAEPARFADAVASLPDGDVRLIMRENAASLLRAT